MARIFSFQIQYKNQSFPTLVSIVNNEQSIVCTVHYVERKIKYLQPGDRLVYCRTHGLQLPHDVPQDFSEALNNCLSQWATIPASEEA
jgi:hypothetical protein